jgi:hypothetical protein
MLALWGEQVPHGWVTGDDELGRHTQFRQQLRARGERYVLGVPCPPHHTRPGGPMACLSGARTAAEATVAVGNGLAESP